VVSKNHGPGNLAGNDRLGVLPNGVVGVEGQLDIVAGEDHQVRGHPVHDPGNEVSGVEVRAGHLLQGNSKANFA